ncbi:MAG: VOC family protein [Ignavibacteriales bacterium]|nr:VOC family protein [Ignavibacteriales bacterium]
MKVQLIFILVIFSLLAYNCNNQSNVEESKKITQNEAQQLEAQKDSNKIRIEALSDTIGQLKEQKSLIEKKTAESEVFSIVKNSFFDHVIIGTNNLNKSSTLFTNLGFLVKEGNKHKNGITNSFVEFIDGSEIELMEVDNPTDELSKEYGNLINANKYGLQFAVRVDEINKLKSSFSQLNKGFTELSVNNTYNTLSLKNINSELPIFFIQYNSENNNVLTNHKNKAKRISAIWISTKDIKQTAKELVNFGFDAIDNYKIPEATGKVIRFKNNNFEIILIESDKYEISGITILVEDIKIIKNTVKSNLSTDFIEQNRGKVNTIILKPEITKSIWIEFSE